MNWKARVKHAIPPSVLNRLLLRFPALYGTSLVYYETTLQEQGGVRELLAQLGMVLRLPGHIIECGSSRCGASILMANFLREKLVQKTIFALDSYQGFDRVELDKERIAGLTRVSDGAFTSTSYAYVTRKLKRLGMDNVVIPVKGYFRDTLPQMNLDYCFALIDCDLQDSIEYCARMIWPRLASGGRMVFDDYASDDFRGARLGVDAFVAERRDEIAEYGLLKRLYYVCKR